MRKYLLSAFVLVMTFVAVSPQTTSAFWPFDYFKQGSVQKNEDLTGAVVKAKKNNNSDSQVSLCQLVDLFIGLGIISPEKAVIARQAVSNCATDSLSLSDSQSLTKATTSLVTVISPNGGETYDFNSTQYIKFQSIYIKEPAVLKLYSYLDGVNIGIENIGKSVSGGNGEVIEYKWKPQADSRYKYKIYVELPKVKDARVYDFSDAPFSIVSSSSSYSSSSTKKPHISYITPKSGAVGSKATLLGRGFIETSSVGFGEGLIDSDQYFYPCGNDEGIDCADFYVPNSLPGTYPVYIHNSNGISNKVNFKIISSPDPSSSSSSSSSIEWPHITVLAPSGGQIVKGANTTIHWTLTPFSTRNFGINLLHSGNNEGDLAANIRNCDSNSLTSTNGRDFYYVWKAGFDAGNREIPNGRYVIIVYDCAGGTSSGWGESGFDLISLSENLSANIIPTGNLEMDGSVKITIDLSSNASNAIFSGQITGGNGPFKCYWDLGEGGGYNSGYFCNIENSKSNIYSTVGNRYSKAGRYTVRFKTIDSLGKMAESKPLIVDAIIKSSLPDPTSKSPITILLPNGGEMWKVGQTQEIKWKIENTLSDSKVNLEIFKEGTDKEFATAIYHGLSATTSSYKWTIPSMMVGNYRILARIISANGIYVSVDTSDVPFSIAN